MTACRILWWVMGVVLVVWMLCRIAQMCHNEWLLGKFEVVPETMQVLDGEQCDPCKYGWAPVECACRCKFKDVPTGRYFLQKKGGAK